MERLITMAWRAQRRAKAALELLHGRGLLEPVRSGTRPMYRLKHADSTWIWLPNEIVDGVGEATSPLERIRQTGDAMTLRLFVDLYGAHGLRDDGGVSRSVIYQAFTRHTVGTFAEYTIYGFEPGLVTMLPGGPVAAPHIRHVTKAEIGAGIGRGDEFFRRLDRLFAMRMFEWVPTLWEHDGPDAEPVHPVHLGSSIQIEADLAAAADDAGRALVMASQLQQAEEEGCTLFVPVLRHLEKAAVIGVARLTHRPHTRPTSRWFGALHQEGAIHLRQYEALIKRGVNMSQWRAG